MRRYISFLLIFLIVVGSQVSVFASDNEAIEPVWNKKYDVGNYIFSGDLHGAFMIIRIRS